MRNNDIVYWLNLLGFVNIAFASVYFLIALYGFLKPAFLGGYFPPALLLDILDYGIGFLHGFLFGLVLLGLAQIIDIYNKKKGKPSLAE